MILARDARPERDPGLILRVAAASATTGLPMAALDPEPAGRDGAGAAHAVAAPGAQGSVGDAGRRSDRGVPPSRRWTEPGCGAGCSRSGVRCATCRRATSCTSGPSTATSSKPSRGQAHSPPGCRGPTCWCSARCCHDIGKGRGGDHSVIGADLATQIGTRLGLWPSDVEVLSKIVRYHLLLPHTATRRDLQDPKTIAAVVDALGGDPVLLELLHVLAEADSLATGPGVWGDWKASLIGDLVRRCRLVMAGEPLPHPDPIDPHYLSLAADGRRARRADACRQRAHLQRDDDRARSPRPAVQGGRRARAEFAARALGVGQQSRGRRRSTPSWCHRISVRHRPPSCCASSSSWPSSGDLDVHRRRWTSATGTRRSHGTDPSRRRCRRGADQPRRGPAEDPLVRRPRAG